MACTQMDEFARFCTRFDRYVHVICTLTSVVNRAGCAGGSNS